MQNWFRGIILILVQLFVEDAVLNIAKTVQGIHCDIQFGMLFGLGCCMMISNMLLMLDLHLNERRINFGAFTINLGNFFLGALSFVVILSSDIVYNRRSELLPPFLNLIIGASSNLNPDDVFRFDMVYGLFPWLGIFSLGILAGKVIHQHGPSAYRYFAICGVVCWSLFAALRTFGIERASFPEDFVVPSNLWDNFFMLSTFPPSLAFLLFFLGCNLLVLSLIFATRLHERQFGKFLIVFGRTPLCFYIVHLLVFLVLSLVWNRDYLNPTLSILWAYPNWVMGLLVLYPICLKFAGWKSKKNEGSIWKFF